MIRPPSLALASIALVVFIGCSGDDSHSHGPDDDHSHDDHADDAPHTDGDGHVEGDHHVMIELGASMIGPYSARVTRDEGAVTPGGDLAIDAWITGPEAPTAVRFWVGVDSAEGSIKARAEIEGEGDDARWHTHVELPSPLHEGAAVWVEIESSDGTKYAGSFDLKQ
jgi:hypothetical protein